MSMTLCFCVFVYHLKDIFGGYLEHGHQGRLRNARLHRKLGGKDGITSLEVPWCIGEVHKRKTYIRLGLHIRIIYLLHLCFSIGI